MTGAKPRVPYTCPVGRFVGWCFKLLSVSRSASFPPLSVCLAWLQERMFRRVSPALWRYGDQGAGTVMRSCNLLAARVGQTNVPLRKVASVKSGRTHLPTVSVEAARHMS